VGVAGAFLFCGFWCEVFLNSPGDDASNLTFRLL